MKRKVHNFEESLKKIGLGLLSEDVDGVVEDITTEDSTDEIVTDSLESEYVSEELLTRIQGLPFEKMEESDFDDLAESLKSKKFNENAPEELKKLAEETVSMLFEVKRELIRKAKAGSMAKTREYKCPSGFRQNSDGRCIPSRRAAGGSGKLAQEKREKKKWRRTGGGQKSLKKSLRWSQRRESGAEVEEMSIIAKELRSLVEDTSPVKEALSERDELIGRLVNIIDMLSEEYSDKDVTDIYEEHLESLLDSYEVGRLDEGLMSEEDFLTALGPVLNLIKESYRKLDGGEELGN